MSKQQRIIVKGTVVDVLPNTKFMVKLENGQIITTYLSGKMRKNYIRIVNGDSVELEMSPYDLTLGRIIYRN